MQSNEDRELQIELAKLQIKRDHAMSAYMISLSVLISMILTTLSVYVPLGVVTNNLLYIITPVAVSSVLLFSVYWIINKMKQTEEQLQKEIQELKKYLW